MATLREIMDNLNKEKGKKEKLRIEAEIRERYKFNETLKDQIFKVNDEVSISNILNYKPNNYANKTTCRFTLKIKGLTILGLRLCKFENNHDLRYPKVSKKGNVFDTALIFDEDLNQIIINFLLSIIPPEWSDY